MTCCKRPWDLATLECEEDYLTPRDFCADEEEEVTVTYFYFNSAFFGHFDLDWFINLS